jgi:hypothetical protein
MPPTVIPSTPALPLFAFTRRGASSASLAPIIPSSVDSCWLDFRGHSSSRAIQSLPFPPRGLHPLTLKRSSVLSEVLLAAPLVRAFSHHSRFGLSVDCALSASECLASLADDMATMPSADFCPPVRPPFGNLSRHSDTGQISWVRHGFLACGSAQ